MGLYDFSNAYDTTANASNTTVAAAPPGSVLAQPIPGGLGTPISSPSVLANSGSSAVNISANFTMLQARSTTSQQLTGLLTQVVPRATTSILVSLGSSGGSPSVNGAVISGGAQSVLGAVGVSLNSPVRTTNPTVYNNGVAAANTLATQANSGNTNVSSMVSGSLEPIAQLVYADTIAAAGSILSGATTAAYTPYATDLIAFAPKYNFMFVVEVAFNPGFEFLGQLNGNRSKFAMIVQEFDRPRISFDHEEYNFYNFRSKVVKRASHENLKLKFIDDRQNASFMFMMQYLLAIHPILGISPQSAFAYEESGMAWAVGDSSTGNDITYETVNSASTRALPGNALTAISEIKVYHVYDYGSSMNVYHFIRPKVVGIDLDRWDMKGSADNCTIEAEFTYDGMYLEPSVSISASVQQRIELLSQASLYPMTPMQQAASTITQAVAQQMPVSNSLQSNQINPSSVISTPLTQGVQSFPVNQPNIPTTVLA